MKSLDDLIQEGIGLDTDAKRNEALRHAIGRELQSSPPPLQAWMMMMEQSLDLLSMEMIKILMADMPQEDVEVQARGFADYLKTQRAIMLFEIMEKQVNNPASKLLVPKR